MLIHDEKIIGLCFLLSACQKVDEQVIIPQEISRVSINTAVREDITSDEGQVQIVEIEDEPLFVPHPQFVPNKEIVRDVERYVQYSPSADSIFQVYEKRKLQEVLIVNKDSI